MKLSITRVIFFKEMLDTLRDKKTMIAMVGVPIVLYPALFLIMGQMAMVQATKVMETTSKVFVQGDKDSLVKQWIQESSLGERSEPQAMKALGERSEPLGVESPQAMKALIKLTDLKHPADALMNGELDAIVIIKGSLKDAVKKGDTVAIEIRYDITEASSREALFRLNILFKDMGEILVKGRLKREGLPYSFARPLDVWRTDIAPPSKVTGMTLGMLLPFLLIMMLAMGAIPSAIDLTAGEKERGTFETLLSTPASIMEIVFGKFIAVFCLCMFTGILNLGSLGATIIFQVSQAFSVLEDSIGKGAQIDLLSLPPKSFLAVVVVMVPLAFFISAAMMAIAMMARSYKEAANYVTPFMLLVIFPSVVSVFPGIKLNAVTQLIPITNISLLFRDILTGKAETDTVFIIFVSTAVYALLTLVFAVWLFQREEVILSEERGLPLTLKRSAFIPSDVPTPGTALGLTAVAMLLLFYVGSYVQSKDIHIGLLITEYGVILAPVVVILWYVKLDLRKSLNIHRTRPGVVVGAVLMSLATLPLVLQLAYWQNMVLPVPKEFEEFANLLFNLEKVPWGLTGLLFVFAVSPALCEEALFRGVLVSGLRHRVPAWAVVLIVGVMFGLFHMSIYRFVVTGVLGLVLTYVVVRSGSIIPAVIGHFLVNASSVLFQTGHAPESWIQYVEDKQVEAQGVPGEVLIMSIVVFLIGILVVEWSARSKRFIKAAHGLA